VVSAATMATASAARGAREREWRGFDFCCCGTACEFEGLFKFNAMRFPSGAATRGHTAKYASKDARKL
jgi:hypothetical protein